MNTAIKFSNGLEFSVTNANADVEKIKSFLYLENGLPQVCRKNFQLLSLINVEWKKGRTFGKSIFPLTLPFGVIAYDCTTGRDTRTTLINTNTGKIVSVSYHSNDNRRYLEMQLNEVLN